MGRTDVVEVVISIADRRVPYAQLVDAVQRIHPQGNVHKVGVAEPSFRPSGPGWVDAAGPERVLASLEPDARGLYGALSALKTIATYPAIILRAGALGVQGPLDSLVPSGAAFHVVPKLLRADVDDGLFPRLAEVGSNVSTSVAAFGTGGDVTPGLCDRLS